MGSDPGQVALWMLTFSDLLLVAVGVQPVILPLPVVHVRDFQLLLLLTLGQTKIG